MKVYERHLVREIGGATLLVLAAFLALFAFFDLMHEMGDVGRQGYALRHALGYVALTLPVRAYEILPVAVLIGALYALTMLAKHSEITVLRASGLSTSALLATLAKLGAIFALLTFLVGEFLAPPAARAAQQLRLDATSSVVGQEFRSGLWLKDGRSFINVREVLPDATLRGIVVYAFDENFRLHSISAAAEGRFVPPDRWRLGQVSQTLFDGIRASVRQHEEMHWVSAINPDMLAVLLVAPERMSLVSLGQYIRHLAENRQETRRHEIALWKKLVYPLATLVMLALALPFAYRHDRTTAVSTRVFAGVMIGILFHMLNGLFSHLGMIHGWRPLVAAVAPSLMFLLAAVAMLWWVERR